MWCFPLSSDFSQVCTLILFGLFPRFSQARLLPFMVTILTPTVRASAAGGAVVP